MGATATVGWITIRKKTGRTKERASRKTAMNMASEI
jgi:hypothetical protein